MRGFAVGAAMLALAGFAAQAENLPAGFTAEDAHAGCLHNDLRPCMIALGLAFWFDMRLVTPQLAIRNELDVNGQTAHRNVFLGVKLPNHNETAQIVLTLGSPTPNDQVIRAELHLPLDPHAAHTHRNTTRRCSTRRCRRSSATNVPGSTVRPSTGSSRTA